MKFHVALTMSQLRTYLPDDDHPSSSEPPFSEMAEAPDVKKFKMENAKLSINEDLPKRAVPSSAYLCGGTSTLTTESILGASLATLKFNFPSSAVKISGSSVTCGSSVSSYSTSAERDEDQNMKEDAEREQLPLKEHTSITVDDQAMDSQATNVVQGVAEAETSSDKDDCAVSGEEQEAEGMDNQDEMHAIDQVGDESDDGWKMLPLFDSESVDGDQVNKQTNMTAAEGTSVECRHKKRSRNRKKLDTATASAVKEKPKRVQPNAFVSVRIPSSEIRGKLEEIQTAMLAKDNRLKRTFVPLPKNHITLMVLRLNHEDSADIEKYVSKVTVYCSNCQSTMS